jgi:hypothetical protein
MTVTGVYDQLAGHAKMPQTAVQLDRLRNRNGRVELPQKMIVADFTSFK